MSGLFTFKAVHNNSDWYTPVVNNQNTRLSSMSMLALPNIFSTHSRQSVQWVGTRIWNGLPQELREQDNYDTFKLKLKKLILS
jgi:hypothetical protein